VALQLLVAAIFLILGITPAQLQGGR